MKKKDIYSTGHRIQDTVKLDGFTPHTNNSLVRGFTLMETMVVLALFSVLAILVTYVVVFSVRGTRKSEAIYTTREQVDSAVEIIERQLRNASEITSIYCNDPAAPGGSIEYVDQNGINARFDCGNKKIASESAEPDGTFKSTLLLGGSVQTESCQFTCYQSADVGIPQEVNLSITASDENAQGIEASSVSVETKILLRNY